LLPAEDLRRRTEGETLSREPGPNSPPAVRNVIGHQDVGTSGELQKGNRLVAAMHRRQGLQDRVAAPRERSFCADGRHCRQRDSRQHGSPHRRRATPPTVVRTRNDMRMRRENRLSKVVKPARIDHSAGQPATTTIAQLTDTALP
jgi:hypothetical protein